MMIDYSLLK